MFLNAHSGFCRDEIQDYLNLYSFVINSPSDHLEKVEKIINLVFENPKSLKYREQFGLNTEKNYVLWAWKGNYLNLGAGAEVGFYTQDSNLEYINENFHLEQWMVEGEMPMTLSLYKRVGTNVYLNYFHWFPHLEQWWITGFVPNIYDYSISAEELIHISSVDFSADPDMLYDLQQSKSAEENKDKLIFDEEDKKLWIIF